MAEVNNFWEIILFCVHFIFIKLSKKSIYCCFLTDGKTGSGECFQGPIGKMISGRQNRGLAGRERPMVDFIPIPGLVGEDAEKWLEDPKTNKDIKTLIRLCQLIQNGPPNEPFTCCPGPVHNARWVTLGSNILYLYR